MANKLPFIAGMTWGWTGVRGTWDTPEAEESMRLMVERCAVTWTAVTFSALQDTAQSTEIHWQDAPTVTDDEVRTAVARARALGQKVVLKPVVNVADGTWRAHINFFDLDVPCEPTWGQWFASYTAFVVHHARLAAELDVEMLCIGCEMVQTDKREAEWRELVRQVREVYPGLVTYNCDKYQEANVRWWDAVDVISSSGYYPVGTWAAELDRIEAVVRAHGKPFFFMEAGCPSREGSQHLPNDWALEGPPSQAAQHEYYAEMFSTTAARGWVDGFVLWDWPARLDDEATAAADGSYCVFGKQAEATVREHYTAQVAARGA